MKETTIESIIQIRISFRLLKGDEVFSQLLNNEFILSWDKLYNSCPWATMYQSSTFVDIYFKIFQDKELAVLVTASDGPKLLGLLALTRDKHGVLFGAGGFEAEYHTWLATPSKGDWFINNALLEVRKHFPNSDIQFKYVPGNSPLKWLNENNSWNKRCLIRVFDQPLMYLQEEHITSELRKKNRREKINRLKRIGDLKFERIKDYQTFSSVLDELATQYDFRKGAMFNRLPFRKNPRKKELLLSLFKLNLLHVTVLKLNEEIIASNVGTIGGSWIHLQGINSHSPFYAKHSPGILHFLMLGRSLAEEGFEAFDLTPGGDSYKDALATGYVQAYDIRITSSYTSFVKFRVRNLVWDRLAKAGLNPKAFKHKMEKRMHLIKEGLRLNSKYAINSLLAGLINREMPQEGIVVYSLLPASNQEPLNSTITLSKNNLTDLLNFKPVNRRWEFLEDAMKRFETGQHAYTYSQNGLLIGCAWLAPLKNGLSGSILNDCSHLAGHNNLALLNLYCHSKDGHQFLEDFLLTVVSEVVEENGGNELFAIAYESNISLQKALDSTGFKRCSK